MIVCVKCNAAGDHKAACDVACAACHEFAVCADFEGRALCYSCWHAARELTQAYHVRHRTNPARYLHVAWVPCVYTQVEAEERARDNGDEWAAVPADSWDGERVAHPGYMARRRRAVQAALREGAER